MSVGESGHRYEALILDFGGVLTTPLQAAMEEFAVGLGLELQDLARVALRAYAGEQDDLVTGFETGRISEEDFSQEFATRLAEVAGRPVDPEGLVTRLFAGLRIEEEMLAAVAAVKERGLKTGLLSNSWGTRSYPRDRLDLLFDAVVISGEVGMRKPDPEIFLHAAEALTVAPEACIFVDDHPGHLKAAAAQGMTTVLHRSPRQTIAELEALLGLSLSSRGADYR